MLTPQWIKWLLAQLPGSFDIILFGSRALGTAQSYSDVDLCLKSHAGKPMDWHQLAKFKINLEDSDFPYVVDLVDYYCLAESFQAIIERDGVLLS